MEIIQSFWSKPFYAGITSNKSYAGWNSFSSFCMSWALSCLTLKKTYGNVKLITDEQGYKLLIEKLKLPYDSYEIILDEINQYPSELWALGKIFTYKQQSRPFIHFDGDIFLWEKLPSRIYNAPIVAQNRDFDVGHYTYALQQLEANHFKISPLITKYQKTTVSINAGIIGGRDIDFFKEFATEAMDMIDQNIHKNLDTVNPTSYAIVYEQLSLAAFAKAHKKEISFLFDDTSIENHQNVFNSICDFSNKYFAPIKYTHLMANTKRNAHYCYEMANQLSYEFPEVYNQLKNIH